MGIYEVTQEQWAAVMGTHPSYFGNNPTYPVERVSWNDCQRFIARINTMGIGSFRLPTEAEWEYACRAGSTTRFPWGDDSGYSQLWQYAWYGESITTGKTHYIGQKKPNAWGLYDMHGNVEEWCSDWYGTYASTQQIDPKGASTGSKRVVRGGSWYGSTKFCRSAHRYQLWPMYTNFGLGFRIVWEGDYTVNGSVKDVYGKGMQGVVFSVSGRTYTTNYNGNFTIYGLSGDVKIAPSPIEGYVFTPGQLSVSGPTNSLTFTAEYSVSGRVTDNNGNGISGVLVKAGSRSVMTSHSGAYELTGLGGSQSIVPFKEGYAFSPAQKMVSGPEKGADFKGGYVISGKVVDSDGVGIEAVTVSAGDIKAGTTKDGSFRLEGLSGSVRVTASKEGYIFSPIETVLTGPATNLSFIALYEVKGFIRDEDGNGLEGIEVLAGDKKAVTDAAGAFKLEGLSGKKKITISKVGYSFEPFEKDVAGPGGILYVLGIAPPPAVIYSTSTTYKMERLTRDGAPKAYPRLSPDGKMLAYNEAAVTKTGSLDWSIYAITLGQQGRLTVSGRAGTIQPAWMPASDRIIYSHWGLKEKPVMVSQSYRGGAILYINMYPIGDSDQYPDINSDGESIVFQTSMQGINYIHTLKKNNSDLLQITRGIQPRWKPGGNTIAYVDRIGKYYQVLTVDNNNEQLQLTQGEYDNLFPCWSPDGEWIAFISNMDGKYHLYVMRADGTNLTQLTRGDSEAFYCDWGSDGWLYFVSDAGSPSAKIRDPWSWRYSDVWRLQPVLPK